MTMRNEDDKGVAHYPGWSMEVLKYLYEERKITASGHETTDTDPGVATSKEDYSLETYIHSPSPKPGLSARRSRSWSWRSSSSRALP